MLEPLRTAHSLLESDRVSLGDVVDCFGQLLRHVSNMDVEGEVKEELETAIEVSPQHLPHPLHFHLCRDIVRRWRQICGDGVMREYSSKTEYGDGG